MNRREFLALSATLIPLGTAVAQNVSQTGDNKNNARIPLGLTSYSYHLQYAFPADSNVAPTGVSWFFEQAEALHLDGMQLELYEITEASEKAVAAYRASGRYLELASATWEREELIQRLSLAARLRARCLRAFLSFDPWAWKHYREHRPVLMKKLEEAALLAEQAGILLTLENHSDYAAWQIAEMLADLKTKWVGICFDSGNPPSSLEDPVDAARASAPYVMQTHLRDYKLVHEDYGMVYQGVALGDGDVDLIEITKILRNDSPITVLSVESAVKADPKRTPRENLDYEREAAARSITYARTKLGLA